VPARGARVEATGSWQPDQACRRGCGALAQDVVQWGVMEQSLDGLQERLGYRFKTETLLVQALTHRSHGKLHNERLEFLGDSVLNCAVASMLYGRFARFDEGDLSRLRSNLVKQQALFEIGQSLSLGDFLVLGEGERRS